MDYLKKHKYTIGLTLLIFIITSVSIYLVLTNQKNNNDSPVKNSILGGIVITIILMIAYTIYKKYTKLNRISREEFLNEEFYENIDN